MKEKKIWKENIVCSLVFTVLAFVLAYSAILYSFDKLVADPLYQVPTPVNKNVSIIAIDEKTIAAYGDPSTWNREIPTKLIETLTNENGAIPSVIVLDMMYIGEKDADTDTRFALACEKAGNVITAVNVVQKDKVSVNELNQLDIEENHIDRVEYPYDALKEVTKYGFANTQQDKDGYIRYTRLLMKSEEETFSSLAVVAYKEYCEKNSIAVKMPKTDGKKMTGFTFSGKSGAYEVVSLCDVLDGKIDRKAFTGKIVFMGAYAPGMQDAYNVAVQKSAQMYGVEIHANIFEALLEGKTNLPVSNLLYAVCVAAAALLFYQIVRRMKVGFGVALVIVFIGINLLAGKLLYSGGMVIRLVELPIIVVVIYIYQVFSKYILETIRRRKVVSAFKKYVAPQVVDELSKKGEFQIELGGTSRHIAVLFVDIRGFTPMSENLKPEQVVEILNEYLSLTTKAIFKNGGTLDKFIGDATMAVFNAPFDLEDYIYKAVCTARDIAAGSAELEKRLMERFGRTISYGIGVNCGEAVVGNIGCDFRMDYTAIGDTVNTAARLESNAKSGQILISEAVYEKLKDRLEVTEVGVIPLKGKSKGVFVYSVDKVL